jgi:hypothetical protein
MLHFINHAPSQHIQTAEDRWTQQLLMRMLSVFQPSLLRFAAILFLEYNRTGVVLLCISIKNSARSHAYGAGVRSRKSMPRTTRKWEKLYCEKSSDKPQLNHRPRPVVPKRWRTTCVLTLPCSFETLCFAGDEWSTRDPWHARSSFLT